MFCSDCRSCVTSCSSDVLMRDGLLQIVEVQVGLGGEVGEQQTT